MFNIGYSGAGVLIYHVEKQDKVFVLLGKRFNNPDKGLWSIPGGGWEVSDVDKNGKPDYKETARREMREEIGMFLPADKKHFLHEIWSIDVLFFKWKVFALRMVKRRLPPQHWEFSIMKWFALDEIPAEYLCNKFIHQQVHHLKKFLLKKKHITHM